MFTQPRSGAARQLRSVLAIAGLAVVLSCDDPPTAPRAQATGPFTAIVDGAHGGGNPHFYFLPPLVSQPGFTGTFDPSLLGTLAVEVCEITGSSCGAPIVRFTAASGPDALRIADGSDPHYQVQWKTTSALRAGAIYRLTVLAGTTPLGSADLIALQNGSGKRDIDQLQYFPLIIGRTFPIKFRIEQGAIDSEDGRVGPSGGTVRLLGGRVTVAVPPGAVREEINMTAAHAILPPGTELGVIPGTAVEMGPHGYQFDVPVQLSIQYDPTNIPSDVVESTLQLHKLIDGAWVPVPGSTVDISTFTVTGETPSFSTFAILPFPCTKCGIVPGYLSLDNPVTVGRGLQRAVTVELFPGARSSAVTVTVTSWFPGRALLSNGPNVVGTPSIQVTIPPFATRATFYVQGRGFGLTVLTVSAGGFGGAASIIRVVPPTWEIDGLPPTITTLSPDDEFNVVIGVTNHTGVFEPQGLAAGSSPLVVTTQSLDPGVATLIGQGSPAPGSGTANSVILAAQDRTPATVALLGLALHPVSAGTATIQSQIAAPFIPSPNSTRQITVLAPPLVAGDPVTVGAGLERETNGALGAAMTNAVSLDITSSDPSIALVSPDLLTPGTPTITVSVPAGQTTFSYVVQGIAGTSGTATITISASGFADATATATIVTPALQIVALDASTTTTSADDEFQVEVGIPDATNSALLETQRVRAGGSTLTATLSSSAAAVAQLVTSASATTVAIDPTRVSSPSVVSAGGIALDPITIGNTTVAATIPGFTSTAAASLQVTVGTVVTSVVVTPPSATLNVFETVQLAAAVTDGSIAVNVPVMWSVSGSSVSVSSTGFVTALQPGQSVVQAVADGVVGVATIQVDAAPLDAGPAVTVGAGLQRQTMGSIGGTNPGALVVTITSSDPGVLLVAPDRNTPGQPSTTVNVASGNTFTYYVQGVAGVTATTAVGVSAPNFTDGAMTATVVAPTLEIVNLGAATTTTSADDEFEVRLGIPDGANLTIAELQEVSAGAVTPLAVTLTSSAPTVGRLVTAANSAGALSVTVSIPSLADHTPATVPAGGAAFHSVSVGTTTVSASAVGFVTVPGSSVNVTVGTVVTAVLVSPAGATIDVGGTIQLQATPVDNGAPVNVPVTWFTSSANITVDASGMVTALQSGSGIVTATADGVVGNSLIIVNTAPTATITSPANAVFFPFAQAVTFAGSGADVEDGALTGASLVWTSSIDGQIGTGATPVITTLSIGAHTITLTATDSRGATGTASVQVGINALGSISTATTLAVPLSGTASLPIFLSSPAGAGGVTVSITSADPSRVAAQSATVVFNAGESVKNATLFGASPGSAIVTVSAPGYLGGQSNVTTIATLNILQTSPQSFPQTFTRPITIRLESNGIAAAAPAGGLEITLTATNPACVAVTSPLVIPAGQVSVQATLSYGGSAATTCVTQVTVSAPNVVSDVIQVNVTPTPTIFPGAGASVGQGLQRNNTASLSSAGHGGTTVTLVSSNPALLVLAADATTAGTGTLTVPIPDGQSQVTYYMQAIGATGSANVTVSAPGFATGSAVINVVEARYDLSGVPGTTTSFSPSVLVTVRVGIGSAVGLTELQAVRAGATALTATITNSAASVAQLVTSPLPGQLVGSQTVSLPIAVGQSSTPFSVNTGGALLDPLGGGSSTVTASIPGLTATNTATRQVTVNAPTINPGGVMTVGGGLQRNNTLVLGASNHGGTTVRIESLDPVNLLVAPDATTAGSAAIDVNLFDGQTQVTYYVQALAGSGSASVKVSALGFLDGTTTATLVQPSFDVSGLAATTTSFSPSSPFTVRVGLANPTNTALSELQAVRVGGSTLTATVTNSEAGFAQLLTSAGAAQSVTVQIGPTQNQSPFSVATGGVSFDPTGVGTTTVSATIPGLNALPTASRQVIVSGPTINAGGAVTVADGLQRSNTGILGASDHGGTTVTVTSGDPLKLLLSTSASTIGSASITIPVNNNQTQFTYFMQALSAVGPVTVTASASGFTSATTSIALAQPALDVSGLPVNTTTLSPDATFTVRIGVANAANTALNELQAVRAGGTALTATVTNTDATVARLVTSAVTGQSVTVQIQPAQNQSPSTVATGGMLFDAVGSGTTTVAATITGIIPTTAASRQVTVTAPGINAGGAATVGNGLQRSNTGILGASNHSGVSVTLTSSDPLKLLLAPNATTAGSASISIPVGTNQTQFTYYMQALSNSGVVTVTASAPGFTDGTTPITLASPAFDLNGIGSTTTTLSPDFAFTVRVGIANAGGTALNELQAVRVGAPTLTATVTNSAAAVAQLHKTGITAQTVTLDINAGQNSTPFSLAFGGASFEPLGEGTTTVSASIPGFVAVTAASREVDVDVPTINGGATVTVGEGLQRGNTGILGASGHGGVTVTLTSTDPLKVLLSPTGTTAGSTSITVPVGIGQTQFTYFIQSFSSTGTVPINVSAPGFASTTTFAILANATLDVSGLPATTTAGAANINFTVRVGIANANNTGLTELQGVRAGAGTLTATVTNSNPATARLVTTALTAQSVTVQILAGQNSSPFSVALGGIAFDPLAAGNSVVAATIPGITPTTSATRSIVVNP